MSKQLICLCTLLLTTAAFAQQNEGASSSLFDRFDADKDGRISQQEAQANQTLAANFGTADTNSDGYLTRQEFGATFGGEQRERE